MKNRHQMNRPNRLRLQHLLLRHRLQRPLRRQHRMKT
jgi:hypothetical protein